MADKIKVLFLCTGNSCRSQMAEGWTRELLGDRVEAFSAGIEVHGLNPRAVKVMEEVGVDISQQRSQHLHELAHIDFDLVITVCDNAYENCPVFPRPMRVVHHQFDDPPQLTRDMEDEEEILDEYRRVRDQIGDFVEMMPEILE
jgi:arsenate reductase